MAFCISGYAILGNTNSCTDSTRLHIGYCAGANATAACNVFVGTCAGNNTTGINNTLVGACAGIRTCAGTDITAVGTCAYISNHSGGNNTVIGFYAGGGIPGGVYCQQCNTAVGAYAGWGGNCKWGNVAVGYASIISPTTCPSCQNIALGQCSGECMCHCWNVVIGGSRATGLTTSDNLIIADATGTCYMYGDRLGNIGVGNTAPAVRLHATGAIFATNEIIAYYSDRRLKENIIVIDCALDKVNSLNSVYYTSNELAKKLGFESDKREVGLLADEVEAVAPEVVTLAPFDLDSNKQSKSGENYKTIKYERVVPLLVEAMKELTSIIDSLEKEILEFGDN